MDCVVIDMKDMNDISSVASFIKIGYFFNEVVPVLPLQFIDYNIPPRTVKYSQNINFFVQMLYHNPPREVNESCLIFGYFTHSSKHLFTCQCSLSFYYKRIILSVGITLPRLFVL